MATGGGPGYPSLHRQRLSILYYERIASSLVHIMVPGQIKHALYNLDRALERAQLTDLRKGCCVRHDF
ncbi:hypothetical protein ASF55_18830 [Methylobacterium sp. Leaf119]|nr:hypothetical protein ASF55_18830 [Methylobacterium sp. Leaf119]